MTLVADRIAPGFPGEDLWKPSSFTLTSGAITTIIGISGSGKPTLLNSNRHLEGLETGRAVCLANIKAGIGRAHEQARIAQARVIISTHSEVVPGLREYRIVMTPGQEIKFDAAASA